MGPNGEKRRGEDKADHLIWWLMITFFGVIVLGATAWAKSINDKVEKIDSLEVNINYMQKDVSEIKDIMKYYIGHHVNYGKD